MKILSLMVSLVLSGCMIISYKDVTQEAPQFGSVTKGQRYRLEKNATTDGRTIFARQTLLPERPISKEDPILNKEYSTIPMGSILQIDSIRLRDNITWTTVVVEAKVMSGPYSGRLLNLSTDMLRGGVRMHNFRANPTWLSLQQ